MLEYTRTVFVYLIGFSMTKRNISFSDPQFEALLRVSKRAGINVSELVRRAVDQYLESIGESILVDQDTQHSDD